MTVVRELVGKIALDARKAADSVDDFNRKLDETAEEIGAVEESTKDLGSELEKTGHEGESFARRLSKGMRELGESGSGARKKLVGGAKAVGAGYLAVQGVAIGATAAIGALTLTWAEQASELDLLSRQYRINAEELSGLIAAGGSVGVEFQDVVDGVKDMREWLGLAQVEETGFSDALFELGISVKQFSLLGVTDQLSLLTDRLLDVDDPNRQMALGIETLGEAWVKAGPLFENGGDGIRELTAASIESGAAMDATSIKVGKDLTRSFKSLQGQVKSTWGLVALQLAPTFEDMIKRTGDWIKENKDLIRTDLPKFLGQILSMTEDLVPFLISAADNTVEFVDAMGGIGPALQTAALGFAAIKSSSMGVWGPYMTGALATVAVINLAIKRQEKLISDLDKSRKGRERGLQAFRTGELFEQDLPSLGKSGVEAARLLSERKRLEAEAKALPFESFDVANRRLNELRTKLNSTGGKSGLSGGGSQADRAEFFELQRAVNRGQKLEGLLTKNAEAIDEQVALLRDQRALAQATRQREEAAERAGAKGQDKSTEEMLARFRELALLLRTGKIKGAQRKELEALAKTLDIPIPKSLTPTAPAGKKALTDDEEIAKLVGLGPEGIRKIGELVPTGGGTTINNFAFYNTVERPAVSITVHGAEGQSPAEVGRVVVNEVGGAIADHVSRDQRELTAQLQG